MIVGTMLKESSMERNCTVETTQSFPMYEVSY